MNKFPFEQVVLIVERIYSEATEPSDFNLKSQIIEAVITGMNWDVGEFFDRYTQDTETN